jgi:predicted lipoprotein with Yx(FWY)xxD motif
VRADGGPLPDHLGNLTLDSDPAASATSSKAATSTLQIANGASVNGQTSPENLLTNASGSAVYTLSGDSIHHAKCTAANGCFKVWRPVKVASARRLSKAPGINGKLGVWRRDGLLQVTLGGHPLYTFAGDSQRDAATGNGIHSFGGTWHVIKTNATGATTTPTAPAAPTPTPTAPPTPPPLY